MTSNHPTSSTVDVVIDAPRNVVFDVFADRERTGEFLPLQSRLIREGRSDRQGVGAVHFLGVGPIGVREEVTELVDGHRIAYRVVGGIPVHSHIGAVDLTDVDGGTRVVYTMRSHPSLPVPAALLRLILRAGISAMVSRAGREANRRTEDRS